MGPRMSRMSVAETGDVETDVGDAPAVGVTANVGVAMSSTAIRAPASACRRLEAGRFFMRVGARGF
jgi:hypothetical protein